MKNTDYSIISTPIAFVFELLFNLVWLKKDTVIQQGRIKLIQSHRKYIYNVTEYFY